MIVARSLALFWTASLICVVSRVDDVIFKSGVLYISSVECCISGDKLVLGRICELMLSGEFSLIRHSTLILWNRYSVLYGSISLERLMDSSALSYFPYLHNIFDLT